MMNMYMHSRGLRLLCPWGFSGQEYWSGLPCTSSRGSSQPRDRTCVCYISCIGRQVLYHQHLLGNPALSLAPIKSLFLKSIHLEKRNTRLPYPSSFLLAILSSTWLSSLAPWLPTALRMPRVLGMLHCRCREVTQPQGPEGD